MYVVELLFIFWVSQMVVNISNNRSSTFGQFVFMPTIISIGGFSPIRFPTFAFSPFSTKSVIQFIEFNIMAGSMMSRVQNAGVETIEKSASTIRTLPIIGFITSVTNRSVGLSVEDFPVGSATAQGAFKVYPKTIFFGVTHRKTPNGSSPRLQDPCRPH